jgi:GH25 family lysozyme M1 (1,4-beta-N-acetylmuramidase)
MKTAVCFAAAIGIFASSASASVQGFDISHYQPTVNFAKAYSDGARFVIIKV